MTNPKFAFQRMVAIVGVLLFVGKLVAWRLTNSDAVFSDAMESIVNILAAFMGLYSLYLASKPKDDDHPYGHGKVEFVTSGVEGILIIIAGVMIIVQSIGSLIGGKDLERLDWGIILVALTAIVNYLLGYLSYQKGIKENSLVLQSSGKHLQSDTITTAGVVLSLVLVKLTGLVWIDGVVALFFGGYIIFIGYDVIRKALKGIMDEADPQLLTQVVKILNDHRSPVWIDIHNLKIQKYGSGLHIDGHITLPYYLSLREAHQEMEQAIKIIAKHTDRAIEFNFHMDDCKPFSCEICQIKDCLMRQKPFKKKIEWNTENISQIQKHSLGI